MLRLCFQFSRPGITNGDISWVWKMLASDLNDPSKGEAAACGPSARNSTASLCSFRQRAAISTSGRSGERATVFGVYPALTARLGATQTGIRFPPARSLHSRPGQSRLCLLNLTTDDI